MLTVITGLTGTYCVANWMVMRNTLKLINNTFLTGDRAYVDRHTVTNYSRGDDYIFSYQDRKDGILYNHIAVRGDNLGTLRFKPRPEFLGWWEYELESFRTADECKAFVGRHKLNYVNSNGLINIATNNAKVYILYSDKNYTIVTNLPEDKFHQHLVEYNQLPLSRFMLSAFVVLLGYQLFTYLNE